MISSKMQEMTAGSSLIRAMFEEGKRLSQIYGIENVFDYSLGNPFVEPPKEISEAIKEILESENQTMVHGYMNNSGYEDVRTAIADFTNKRYKTKVTAEHIVMTNGAAGAINIAFKSLLNPGDEVLVFAPFFGEYKSYTGNYEGKLVVVPADTDTFEPNLAIMEEYVSEKTKVVLVNSPNNPSGVVYSEATIIKMTTILKKKEKEYGHSIYLIADEPYRELVYDEIEVPYLTHYYQNTLVAYSYSKTLSLPGERIGYLVVNPEIEDVEKVMMALNVANRVMGFVNAPSLFQRVIAKTLGAKVDVGYYKRNRDTLYQHLTQIGFKTKKPDGAFYLFMKAPIEDDVKFCQDAKQFNLLLVPGSAFGCKGYVRLAYCISYERVTRSLPAFEKLMKLYEA